MEIKIANEILTAGGSAELTAANNELFRQQIGTALNRHTTVEIDLSRTTFMDCGRLGALIALRKFTRGRNSVMRLVTGIGASYQAAATARDMRKYPPPGQMVDVDGYRLHLNSRGEGSPSVVMDAGLGGSSLVWSWVQPEVAKVTRVCTYDRAGLGWSDPGPSPRTSRRIVEELRIALARAEVPGPYVLVGHSFGGFNVRLFAYLYPNEVAGLVLVDSSHEDQLSRFPESWIRWRERKYERYNLIGLLAPFGVGRMRAGPNSGLPAGLQDVARALDARTSSYRSIYSEFLSFKESAAQVREARKSLSIPAIVLTAGAEFRHPGMTEHDWAHYSQVWKEMQKDLASGLPGSRHVLVNDSGHNIQMDQPEAVVTAVLEILKRVRGRSPDSSVGGTGRQSALSALSNNACSRGG